VHSSHRVLAIRNRWSDYDARWLIGRVVRQGSASWGLDDGKWCSGAKSQHPSPKNVNFRARIGVLSQICKTFDWRYLRNYKLNRHEMWTQVSGQELDFVGGPALPHNNSRWRTAAILIFFWQNSAAGWGRFMKFYGDINNDYPKTSMCQKSRRKWIEAGGGRHFENSCNGYISVAVACISTKFCTLTENDVPRAILPSKFTSYKIQDGGGRHFEFRFNDHNLVITAYICTNLAQKLKTTSRIQSYLQISLLRQSKMAAAAIFVKLV